jgi:hypothetical protein
MLLLLVLAYLEHEREYCSGLYLQGASELLT